MSRAVPMISHPGHGTGPIPTSPNRAAGAPMFRASTHSSMHMLHDSVATAAIALAQQSRILIPTARKTGDCRTPTGSEGPLLLPGSSVLRGDPLLLPGVAAFYFPRLRTGPGPVSAPPQTAPDRPGPGHPGTATRQPARPGEGPDKTPHCAAVTVGYSGSNGRIGAMLRTCPIDQKARPPCWAFWCRRRFSTLPGAAADRSGRSFATPAPFLFPPRRCRRCEAPVWPARPSPANAA